MASLTWQDVVGQVRAPDNSAAANMITQGLGNLASAFQAPERLRQEQLDREIKGQMISSQMLSQAADMADKRDAKAERYDTKIKNEIDQQNKMAFATYRSSIENAMHDAGLNGKSFAETLANNPEYQGLAPDAKAYADGILSDAYNKGTALKDHRAEVAQNDWMERQQLSLSQQSLNLQQRTATNAKVGTDLSNSTRKIENDLALQAEKDRIFGSTPLGDMAKRAALSIFNASGGNYTNQEMGAIAKEAGITDITEYSQALDNLNRDRYAHGKGVGKLQLPDDVIKKAIAGQVGKNGTFTNWSWLGSQTNIDAITKNLKLAAAQYDMAQEETLVINEYRRLQEDGKPADPKVIKKALEAIQARYVTEEVRRQPNPPRSGHE